VPSSRRPLRKENGGRALAPIPCRSCPLRANPAYRSFTAEELAFVETFKIGELVLDAGATLFVEGEHSENLFTLLEGWAVRYKVLENGRRQVLNVALSGDLLGLQSVLFDKMLHSVEALSEVRLCVFSRERVWQLFERHAGLAFDVTWLAAREESVLAEHLAVVGQKPARERIAYFLVYLFEKGRRAGLVSGDTLSTPVTQEHLADAMGLSLVHTNKTLMRLRETGLVEWKRQTIRLMDVTALAELAGYTLDSVRPRPFV
jgi:CRP-like cAMP-binding protein